ncbi:hypothetical protein ACFFX0_22675 [Citricoccus parietis]|uniref:Uncharacterized protein n=1 Tax=Citricoccus parietis TaxID=592307 RepID=A0ABV5G5D1_9MICC
MRSTSRRRGRWIEALRCRPMPPPRTASNDSWRWHAPWGVPYPPSGASLQTHIACRYRRATSIRTPERTHSGLRGAMSHRPSQEAPTYRHSPTQSACTSRTMDSRR